MRLPLIVSVFFFIVGCGDPTRPKDLPRLYQTTIKITQDGKELAGATVVLVHEDPAFKWNSAGTTNEQGIVELYTLGKFKGVPEGKYCVTVSKAISIHPKTHQPVEPPKASDPSSTSIVGGVTSSINEMPIPFNIVAREFASQATTSLKMEVRRKRNNETFDVGKAMIP